MNSEQEKAFRLNYDSRYKHYDSFRKELETLLIRIISSYGIELALSQSRIKNIDSVVAKMNNRYPESTDINVLDDIVGIRLVAFYPKEVGRILSMLDSDFNVIDSDNKHIRMELDKVGYIAFHRTIKIGNDRVNNPEWRGFSTDKAEIQIMTILQFTWSEISHKLLYKPEFDITDEAKRKINIYSGLFEIIDNDFESMYNTRDRWMYRLKRSRNSRSNYKIKISSVTIKEFFSDDEDTKYIVEMAHRKGLYIEELDEPEFSPLDWICRDARIETYDDLYQYIKLSYDKIERLISLLVLEYSKIDTRYLTMSIDDLYLHIIAILSNTNTDRPYHPIKSALDDKQIQVIKKLQQMFMND